MPFAVDIHGRIATVLDPDTQAMQHVECLVSTSPGERVMMPDYGIPLTSYLFEPGFEQVTIEIEHDVTSQMSMWEPNLTVMDVTPLLDSDFGVSKVTVDFARMPGVPDSSSPTLTATVHVGGDVTEGS